MIDSRQLETLGTGVVAGGAGGLAEIAWVTLYAGMTSGDPAALARGVSMATGVSALLPAASPVMLGIGVHMILAATLGVVLTYTWQTLSAKLGVTNSYPFMLTALSGVWAINFFVVLPIVSPAFVGLVPYVVSLASKLLFGLAAAEVVRDWARTAARAPVLASAARRPARRDEFNLNQCRLKQSMPLTAFDAAFRITANNGVCDD